MRSCRLVTAAGMLLAALGAAPSVQGQPTTSLDTLFVLGGLQDLGGLTVHEALAALILPDGRVALSQSDGIHLADANGRSVRRLARQGQGPGEVSGVWAIEWDAASADLLWYDFLLLRFTRLDLSTSTVATHRVRPLQGSVWQDFLVRPLEDGRVMALDRTRRPPPPRVPGIRTAEDTALVVVVDSAGRGTQLGSFPKGSVFHVAERIGATGFREGSEFPPGGRRLLTSAAAGSIALVYSDDPRIQVLASDGIRWSVVAPVARERLSDADWRRIQEAYVQVEERVLTTPDGRSITLDPASRRQKVLEVAERPAWRPLFDQIHMSLSGEVWLREATWEATDVVRWLIVRGDGTSQLATLPANFELLSIRDRTVVTRARDALDVELVVVLVVR